VTSLRFAAVAISIGVVLLGIAGLWHVWKQQGTAAAVEHALEDQRNALVLQAVEARNREPFVFSIGEERFELPAGETLTLESGPLFVEISREGEVIHVKTGRFQDQPPDEGEPAASSPNGALREIFDGE